MVDAVDLWFVEIAVQLRGQGTGRVEVVPERLLDHDPAATADEPRAGQTLHHGAK